MKKLAVLALIFFLCSSQSQAKTTSVERVLASQKHSATMNQMLMKSVVVRVTPRTQRRLLVIEGLTDDENDDAPGPDELDLQAPYRRPRIVDNAPDDSISDYVTVRLAVARARAMEIYRNKMNT
jgi:hypothetical protein